MRTKSKKKTTPLLYVEALTAKAEVLEEFARERFEHEFDRASDAERTALFSALDRLAAASEVAASRLERGPSASEEEYEEGAVLGERGGATGLELARQGHLRLVADVAHINDVLRRTTERIKGGLVVRGRKL